MIKNIAVLGAGTIGSSWAAFFSARGLAVSIFDPDPKCLASVQSRVTAMHASLDELGLLAGTPGRITLCDRAGAAVETADFVQENAIERLEEKLQLYKEIAPFLADDAIVASSTSFLMPSALQEGNPFAERLVIGHPFNPPHLIPLVEVVAGRATAPHVVERTMKFYQSIGKKPIHLKKEIAGHLVNRLQAALWREAIFAVRSGLADVADVDAAVAYGPGLRWALMGPHMIFNMAGGDGGMAHFIDHLGDANEAIWQELGDAKLDSGTVKALVDGCLTEADGQSMDELRAKRDKQLLAVLRDVQRVI